MKFVNVAATCCTVLLQVHVIVSDLGPRPCPQLELLNGRVRFRSRGRVAKFKCDSTYQLLGNRTATCIRGTWDTAVPLCIKNECSPIPKNPRNGYWIENYKGASYTLLCNTGYRLHGVRVIYCHNKQWSDTIPYCVEVYTTCDFEKEDLCGWTQDMHDTLNWSRHNFDTPSSHVGTGPSYDHTLGQGSDGHYMYIEASSPHLENDTARLLSPAYEPQLSEQACFIFWYHMYGATTGDLNVYQKLQSSNTNMTRIFRKSGEQGNQWLMGYANLTIMSGQFQIVIEAIKGRSYLSDIAIDDVKLLKGEECLNVTKPVIQPSTQITVTSPPMTAEPAITIPKTARAYPTFLPPPPPPTLPPLHSLFPASPFLTPTMITSAQSNTEEDLHYQTTPKAYTKATAGNTYNASTPPLSSNYYRKVTPSFNFSLNKYSTGHLTTLSSLPFGQFSSEKRKPYLTTWFSNLHISTTRALQLSTKSTFDRRYNTITKTISSTQSSTLLKYNTRYDTSKHTFVPKQLSTSPQLDHIDTAVPRTFNFPVETPPSYKQEDTRYNTLTHTDSAYTIYNERHSTVTQNYLPIQRSTAFKNGIQSPFKNGYRTTLEPSTVLKESKAEANVSHLPSIAGAAGGIATVAVVAALLVFILSRRITRFKKQRDMSEDSDVRFLTSDEVLDFTLARPNDDDL